MEKHGASSYFSYYSGSVSDRSGDSFPPSTQGRRARKRKARLATFTNMSSALASFLTGAGLE
jgi:hypothetical protein